jgi:hypothetical protein
LVGINEISDAKGDKIVLSNIRVPGALFLDDLTQGVEKGIYTEKFALEGVGYARGVNAMIDEILKKGKKLSKTDRDYIRKMKSQVDEGELYAYGSIDGVSVIVPYSEIKGALNKKLDKPYEYSYTEEKENTGGSYIVNGQSYNIPSDQIDDFLKDFPNAKKQ